jgi:hypothetical protein
MYPDGQIDSGDIAELGASGYKPRKPTKNQNMSNWRKTRRQAEKNELLSKLHSMQMDQERQRLLREEELYNLRNPQQNPPSE